MFYTYTSTYSMLLVVGMVEIAIIDNSLSWKKEVNFTQFKVICMEDLKTTYWSGKKGNLKN